MNIFVFYFSIESFAHRGHGHEQSDDPEEGDHADGGELRMHNEGEAQLG